MYQHFMASRNKSSHTICRKLPEILLTVLSGTLTRTFQEKVHWRADGGVFWQQHCLGIRLKSSPSMEKQRIKLSSGSRDLLPRFYPVKAVEFLYFHYAREGMSEHNSWVTIYCEWKLYLISQTSSAKPSNMETMVLEALSVAMKPVTEGLMDSSQMHTTKSRCNVLPRRFLLPLNFPNILQKG